MKNPYFYTKQFWFNEFRTELTFGDQKLAEEHFLRYRYWLRREKLWEFLAQLCKEKGFRPKEFGNAG